SCMPSAPRPGACRIATGACAEPASQRCGRTLYCIRNPSNRARLPLEEIMTIPLSGKSDRILVTGGAGFLGSHLCDALLGEGHSVVCVDNLLTGRRQNIAHLGNEPRFQFLEFDICQPFDFGRVDKLYHLACPASPV